MIRKIENDFLSVDVNDKGGEVFSIKSKKSGTEFLWQGNSSYWCDRSPILFPICGRLFNGKYVYKEKEYQMPIHGIAKLYDFTVTAHKDDKLSLLLKSNEDTKKYYPFDFEFLITYSLDGNVLKTNFNVKNTGKKDMYFSYGGHPGFNVPFSDNDCFEDYFIELGQKSLGKIVMSDTCFYKEKTQSFSLDDGKLKLKHELFDNDALFFTAKDGAVKLKSTKTDTRIEIAFKDMTCLGVWHKPKSDAPYVCIEPWHGIPSVDGVVDNLQTKKDMIKLTGNEVYENSYEIKITE